jgi:hypothetical protein
MRYTLYLYYAYTLLARRFDMVEGHEGMTRSIH